MPASGRVEIVCGIIGVVSRPVAGPDRVRITEMLAEAVAFATTDDPPEDRLARAAESVTQVVSELEGPQGCVVVFSLLDEIEATHEKLATCLADVEESLASNAIQGSERLNEVLTKSRDAFWSLKFDRLRTAREVAGIVSESASSVAIHAGWAIQVALSGLDRLEVRGRDSAGLAIVVAGASGDVEPADPLLPSGSVLSNGSSKAFVYKTAQEVGELGQNSRVLRRAILSDERLLAAIAEPGSSVTVLAHTRWASIGLVSESNAHPLHHGSSPEIIAVLNGDIDNHNDFREGLEIPSRITTDAKVIPGVIARAMSAADGLSSMSFEDAFLGAVAQMQGATAIAALALDAPTGIACSLKGSGQGLAIGRTKGAWLIASEAYALVEQCSELARLDGDVEAGRGQAAIVFDESRVVDLASGRGVDLQWETPEVTTRDVDLGGWPHYLLKELVQSPMSVEATLRGRINQGEVALGNDALPASISDAISDGSIRRVVVIGQGTAAIAASGVARLIEYLCEPWDVRVASMPATEFSGFETSPSMTDTLVVAISQSGTTADTNRTVEVARSRGAKIIAIVNRRNSDLQQRSDGVIYTSDGRDVEMAVPSTKAFYSQIVAGGLLAASLAQIVKASSLRTPEFVAALQELPSALRHTLEKRDAIAKIAHELGPTRRHWAVVGSGLNIVAAQEIRIKISELCYASISCDYIEDKKHIDLSAEPLIIECAAGLHGSIAADIRKEIAYHSAHRAAPVVIASEGFGELDVPTILVPNVHPKLDFICATMVGHIFGYEAALAIDALADDFRAATAIVTQGIEATEDVDDAYALLSRTLREPAARIRKVISSGNSDGPLRASVAVRVLSALRYATQLSSMDSFESEFGEVGSPEVILRKLLEALSEASDELTRPIDAIKHQAKTVTVGISRADEGLASVLLVAALLDSGVELSHIGYRNLRSLEALSRAVNSVTGHTRYRIEGDPSDEALVTVISQSGVASGIPSRTKDRPVLRGAKRRVAIEGDAVIARGAADGRTVVIVPETSLGNVRGMTLLHVDVVKKLDVPTAVTVLEGYRDRLALLRDLVLETELLFDTSKLERIDPTDLLVLPLSELAKLFRE